MTELSRLIRVAYRRNGIVSAYVYGDFGFGKTSYALWTAYEVLGSWDKVLNYLFFNPKEAINTIGEAIYKGVRLPIIIMDDAGLWLGKLTWWEEDKVAFMEFYNLIRSVSAGIIFTAPVDDLPKSIRKKAFFRIEVSPTTLSEVAKAYGSMRDLEEFLEHLRKLGLNCNAWSKAVGYKLKTLPTFFQYPKKKFIDFYPQHYPVFLEYERKRREALKEAYEKWKNKLTMKQKENNNRSMLREVAAKLAEKGATRREIVELLIKHGIPRSTAYRWVKTVV